MHDIRWSDAEKRIARRAFDAARDAALEAMMTDFRERAAAVTTPEEMWGMEEYLRRQSRLADDLLDYRYSQLLRVFARLIHMGYLDESRLAGLSADKIEAIRRNLAWMSQP